MELSCLACELTRARLKAAALALVGWPLERIAEHLSNAYGENYYVGYGDEKKAVLILRASKLAPFEPHFIYERGEE